jgi:hypothetical protein
VGDVFIKFRYEERDIANAVRARMIAALRRRPELALAALVCVASAVVAYSYVPPSGRIVIVVLAIAVVALVASTFVVVPKLAFRRRESLREPVTIDASAEGITVTMGATSRAIAWTDCAKVETSGRICMIHHGEDMLILPLRAFRNVEREKAFFELVERFAGATRDARSDDSNRESPRPAQTS